MQRLALRIVAALAAMSLAPACAAQLRLPGLQVGGGATAGSTAPAGSAAPAASRESPAAAAKPPVDCSKFKDQPEDPALADQMRKDRETLSQHTPKALSTTPKFALEEIAAFPATRAMIASVPEKYGALMCAERAQNDGRLGGFERDYREGKRDYDQFTASVNGLVEKADQELPARLGQAKAVFDEHLAKQQDRDGAGLRLLVDDDSDVNNRLRSAAVVVSAVRAVKGAGSPEAAAAAQQYDALHADLQARLTQLQESKLASVQAPREKYAGADKAKLKAALRKAWKEDYPADEVLAIILTGDQWHRSQNTQWWEATQSWRHYDNDWLDVVVVTRKDDKVAEQWLGQLRKDHEDHGTLKFDYASKGGTVPSPILAAKVRAK